MVHGALHASRAQVAVSITGVAGPAGGTATKPVGMVCFGWALAGGNADATTKHFKGDRGEVRRQSVVFALQGLIERIGE
jgi:nicotinamide-nucleotide amidase